MDILAEIGEVLAYTHPQINIINDTDITHLIDCCGQTYHSFEENPKLLVIAQALIPTIRQSISTDKGQAKTKKANK